MVHDVWKRKQSSVSSDTCVAGRDLAGADVIPMASKACACRCTIFGRTAVAVAAMEPLGAAGRAQLRLLAVGPPKASAHCFANRMRTAAAAAVAAIEAAFMVVEFS